MNQRIQSHRPSRRICAMACSAPRTETRPPRTASKDRTTRHRAQEVLMTLKSTFRPNIRFGLKVLGALAFLAPLATRLVMGQAFFLPGPGKLANFPRTAEFFVSLVLP